MTTPPIRPKISSTYEGTACFADLFQLLEDRIIPQIRTTESRYRQALDRLVQWAEARDDILIPMHDPIVWQMYVEDPENWLEELRRKTRKVIERSRR